MKIIRVNGKEIKAYTINEVAKILDIKRITLLRWFRIRLIPETFRTKVGHRVFTERQVSVLDEVYSKYRVRRGQTMDKENFSKEIYEKFNS